jgi:hypothetical protein
MRRAYSQLMLVSVAVMASSFAASAATMCGILNNPTCSPGGGRRATWRHLLIQRVDTWLVSVLPRVPLLCPGDRYLHRGR